MAIQWSDPTRQGVTYQGQMPGRSDDSYAYSALLDQAGAALGTMQSISGYAQAYMPLNHRVAGASGKLELPFSAQLGDCKNAHVEGTGITLDAPGLWVAKALINAAPGSGVPSVVYFIDICDAAGTVVDSKELPTTISGAFGSGAFFEHTFVVTGQDITQGRCVRVRLRHDAIWWTWKGGTAQSGLTVDRWDLSTAGAVTALAVPDGPDIGSPATPPSP